MDCSCFSKFNSLSRNHFFDFSNSRPIRGVVPWCARCTMACPDFGRSVNPISTRGGRLCSPNNTGTPWFSDLPTALPMCFMYSKKVPSNGALNLFTTPHFWNDFVRIALQLSTNQKQCALIIAKSIHEPWK